jgi:hypothetical protein
MHCYRVLVLSTFVLSGPSLDLANGVGFGLISLSPRAFYQLLHLRYALLNLLTVLLQLSGR